MTTVNSQPAGSATDVAPIYEGAWLLPGRLMIANKSNSTLQSALSKVRSFHSNTTNPKLSLSPDEFAALKAALSGEDAIYLAP